MHWPDLEFFLRNDVMWHCAFCFTYLKRLVCFIQYILCSMQYTSFPFQATVGNCTHRSFITNAWPEAHPPGKVVPLHWADSDNFTTQVTHRIIITALEKTQASYFPKSYMWQLTRCSPGWKVTCNIPLMKWGSVLKPAREFYWTTGTLCTVQLSEASDCIAAESKLQRHY